MYDDDRDALAAEYVLGTLSGDERDQAEALLVIDPGFAEIVRVWERRLGELNVMVEAVEPPTDVWDKIRTEIGGAEPRAATEAEIVPPAVEETAPETAPDVLPDVAAAAPPPPPAWRFEPRAKPKLFPDSARGLDGPPPQNLDALAPRRDLDESSLVAALASSLLSPMSESPAEKLSPSELLASTPPPTAPGADIVYLERGVRRWRGITAAVSAIAALLAVYIAVAQFAPGLIPLSRQPQTATAARPQSPGARLVAVLQQDPTAPAFLLTVDPQNRTLTVRRVAATPEADRSYELWLVSSKYPKPQSLGLVGGEEFTSRPLPASFDVDTVRAASYAISLEPAGGSQTGAPSGPILFTGKIVEALPGAAG